MSSPHEEQEIPSKPQDEGVAENSPASDPSSTEDDSTSATCVPTSSSSSSPPQATSEEAATPHSSFDDSPSPITGAKALQDENVAENSPTSDTSSTEDNSTSDTWEVQNSQPSSSPPPSTTSSSSPPPSSPLSSSPLSSSPLSSSPLSSSTPSSTPSSSIPSSNGPSSSGPPSINPLSNPPQAISQVAATPHSNFNNPTLPTTGAQTLLLAGSKRKEPDDRYNDENPRKRRRLETYETKTAHISLFLRNNYRRGKYMSAAARREVLKDLTGGIEDTIPVAHLESRRDMIPVAHLKRKRADNDNDDFDDTERPQKKVRLEKGEHKTCHIFLRSRPVRRLGRDPTTVLRKIVVSDDYPGATDLPADAKANQADETEKKEGEQTQASDDKGKEAPIYNGDEDEKPADEEETAANPIPAVAESPAEDDSLQPTSPAPLAEDTAEDKSEEPAEAENNELDQDGEFKETTEAMDQHEPGNENSAEPDGSPNGATNSDSADEDASPEQNQGSDLAEESAETSVSALLSLAANDPTDHSEDQTAQPPSSILLTATMDVEVEEPACDIQANDRNASMGDEERADADMAEAQEADQVMSESPEGFQSSPCEQDLDMTEELEDWEDTEMAEPVLPTVLQPMAPRSPGFLLPRIVLDLWRSNSEAQKMDDIELSQQLLAPRVRVAPMDVFTGEPITNEPENRDEDVVQSIEGCTTEAAEVQEDTQAPREEVGRRPATSPEERTVADELIDQVRAEPFLDLAARLDASSLLGAAPTEAAPTEAAPAEEMAAPAPAPAPTAGATSADVAAVIEIAAPEGTHAAGQTEDDDALDAIVGRLEAMPFDDLTAQRRKQLQKAEQLLASGEYTSLKSALRAAKE